MPRSRTNPVPAPPGSAGDLVRLLETEQALATRLDVTRMECTAIVDRARDAAANAERQLDAEVEGEREVRARTLAQETAARITVVQAAARDRAARFAAVSDGEVDALAESVLRWLGELAGGSG